MTVELLVHAFTHPKGEKGQVIVIRDGKDLTASPWGKKETLPNWVVIRLTDANAADVKHYMAPELSGALEEVDQVPIETGRPKRLMPVVDVDAAVTSGGRHTTTKAAMDLDIVVRD